MRRATDKPPTGSRLTARGVRVPTAAFAPFCPFPQRRARGDSRQSHDPVQPVPDVPASGEDGPGAARRGADRRARAHVVQGLLPPRLQPDEARTERGGGAGVRRGGAPRPCEQRLQEAAGGGEGGGEGAAGVRRGSGEGAQEVHHPAGAQPEVRGRVVRPHQGPRHGAPGSTQTRFALKPKSGAPLGAWAAPSSASDTGLLRL
eukprot:3284865-Prymnesium_polylepis.1